MPSMVWSDNNSFIAVFSFCEAPEKSDPQILVETCEIDTYMWTTKSSMGALILSPLRNSDSC